MGLLLSRRPACVRPAAAPRVCAGAQPAHRKMIGLPASTADSPDRAGWHAGLTYGIWGVAADTRDRLTGIAQELTAHVAGRARSESLVDLDPHLATLCVITLGGRLCRPLDPRSLRTCSTTTALALPSTTSAQAPTCRWR